MSGIGRASRHDDAEGANLVRSARRASRSHYANRSAAGGRLGRGLGEFLGEWIGEALLAGLALALFAGVVALTIFGWRHNAAATVGVYAIAAGYLSYGGYELLGSRRRGGYPLKRRRLAKVAAGSLILVVLWLVTVLQYHV